MKLNQRTEINAATSVMALLLSDKFDFTKSYFMVAGIAGEIVL